MSSLPFRACLVNISLLLALLQIIGNVSAENRPSINFNFGNITEIDNEGSTSTPIQNPDAETVKIKLGYPFTISSNPENISYYLYTSQLTNTSEPIPLPLNNYNSLITSGIDRSQETVFLVHGFAEDKKSEMPISIKDAYLRAGKTHNIIVVDWSKLGTPNPNEYRYYPVAYQRIVERNVPTVAKSLAWFIQELVTLNLTTLNQIHLVGFSVGAHIAGGAGVILDNIYQEKPARVTGLDPAGPLFDDQSALRSVQRLSKYSANFVDVYHTSMGSFGTVDIALGHAVFFPNGGRIEEHCITRTSNWDFIGGCSSSFAYHIFANSILETFEACKCNYGQNNLDCPRRCERKIIAGEPLTTLPSMGAGYYYFETTSKATPIQFP